MNALRWGRSSHGGAALRSGSGHWPRDLQHRLQRLVAPIDDVLQLIGRDSWTLGSAAVRRILLQAVHEHQVYLWGWSRNQWLAAARTAGIELRQTLVVAAYLLGNHWDLHTEFPGFKRRLLATRVFGDAPVDSATESISGVLRTWGCSCSVDGTEIRGLCGLLLESGSPRLEDIDTTALLRMTERTHSDARIGARHITRALIELRLLDASTMPRRPDDNDWLALRKGSSAGMPTEWQAWADRWFKTSTLSKTSRVGVYHCLMKAGRWVANVHPKATTPPSWTRQLAAEWVAAVDRMLIGDWARAPQTAHYAARLGKPLGPRSKRAHIGGLRTFFRDCQDWEWISPALRSHPLPCHAAID
jgi:hypothetical protein